MIIMQGGIMKNIKLNDAVEFKDIKGSFAFKLWRSRVERKHSKR